MSINRRQFTKLCAQSIGLTMLAACQFQKPPLPASQPQTDTQSPMFTDPQPTSTGTAIPPIANVSVYSFAAFTSVVSRQDTTNLYIESNGMPTHPMMIGIKSWQQQVPLPQNYRGADAFQIPLNPVLADVPISAKTALYRGAIAIAANGIPIFNALNNRGDDALLAGELDHWGGHCGKGDDYHYHVAPLHLEETVGLGNPIAYALDGFAIYGTTEPDGSTVAPLDEFNGHMGNDGVYHYHGTTTYPYINGGLRGIVSVTDDQIEPQPHIHPVRPPQEPLRGAEITNFQISEDGAYSLEYTLNNAKYVVSYTVTATECIFTFINPDGTKTSETYNLSN
ncbi:MAG: YHYH protein [Chloroflexales bacterium]|nr:YHYH protein [Chloroflexales bacterium]